MSDKDFDKIFAAKLSEELNFPIDEKDWERLSTQLDKDKSNCIDSHKAPKINMTMKKIGVILRGYSADFFLKLEPKTVLQPTNNAHPYRN